MNARESILERVRRAGRQPLELPEIDRRRARPLEGIQLIDSFRASARAASATVEHISAGAVGDRLAELVREERRVVSIIADAVESSTVPHSYADTDTFVCRAILGVAENGAVWLPLSSLRYRSALFLATNVIVLLRTDALVADFEDAYSRVDVTRESYGVFVAGPSKTADIEQSLVVGAHGPKSFTILLTSD